MGKVLHGAKRRWGAGALPLLVLLLLATAAVGGDGTVHMERAAELTAAVEDGERAAPEAAPYAPGARIAIHGLTSAVSLNGQLGTVVSLDAEKNRYEISVDGALFNKKIKPANLKEAPPSSGGEPTDDSRAWWAVYDAVAVAVALLTISLTARGCGVDVCCGLCAGEYDDEDAVDRAPKPKSPWVAVEAPAGSAKDGAAVVASPAKTSPPASSLSSRTGASSVGTPEWASSRGSQSSRTGSSSSSSRRFPSKPISAHAEARRQKRMRDGLVARRPMVFPEVILRLLLCIFTRKTREECAIYPC